MIVITDDIGKVVQAMRNGGVYDPYDESQFVGPGTPYYMAGHRLEIANRLAIKDKDVTRKTKKYPLIALRMDISEDESLGMYEYKLNIIIATITKTKLNAEERIEQVFKPILYPLYESFLDKFRKAGLFYWGGEQDMPPHSKVDRPFWGTSATEGNVKNIFNDPIDAIELVNLQFKRRLTAC